MFIFFKRPKLPCEILKKSLFPFKYVDYTNVFLPDSVVELPKHIDNNNYFNNLLNDKQPSYGPIYSLKPVKFEMLKTYIEINLDNNFISPSSLLSVI